MYWEATEVSPAYIRLMAKLSEMKERQSGAHRDPNTDPGSSSMFATPLNIIERHRRDVSLLLTSEPFVLNPNAYAKFGRNQSEVRATANAAHAITPLEQAAVDSASQITVHAP